VYKAFSEKTHEEREIPARVISISLESALDFNCKKPIAANLHCKSFVYKYLHAKQTDLALSYPFFV
jgi:hypothetical protein